MPKINILTGIHTGDFQLTGLFVKLHYNRVFNSLSVINNPLLAEQITIETFRSMLNLKLLFSSVEQVEEYLITYSNTIRLNLQEIIGKDINGCFTYINFIPCKSNNLDLISVDAIKQSLHVIPFTDVFHAFRSFTGDIPNEGDLLKNKHRLKHSLAQLSPVISLTFQLSYFRNYSVSQILKEIDLVPHEVVQLKIQALQTLKSMHPNANIPLNLIMMELLNNETTAFSVNP